MEWASVVNHQISLAGETSLSGSEQLQQQQQQLTDTIAGITVDTVETTTAQYDDNIGTGNTQVLLEDYATFASMYLNTFYCLAIVCMISVFDR